MNDFVYEGRRMSLGAHEKGAIRRRRRRMGLSDKTSGTGHEIERGSRAVFVYDVLERTGPGLVVSE